MDAQEFTGRRETETSERKLMRNSTDESTTTSSGSAIRCIHVMRQDTWIANALDNEAKWELVYCPKRKYQWKSISAHKGVEFGGELNGRSGGSSSTTKWSGSTSMGVSSKGTQTAGNRQPTGRLLLS